MGCVGELCRPGVFDDSTEVRTFNEDSMDDRDDLFCLLIGKGSISFTLMPGVKLDEIRHLVATSKVTVITVSET